MFYFQPLDLLTPEHLNGQSEFEAKKVSHLHPLPPGCPTVYRFIQLEST